MNGIELLEEVMLFCDANNLHPISINDGFKAYNERRKIEREVFGSKVTVARDILSDKTYEAPEFYNQQIGYSTSGIDGLQTITLR